jgi:hypothetical protein
MSIKMTEVYAQSEIPAALLSGGRINIYSQQEQAYTIFQTIPLIHHLDVICHSTAPHLYFVFRNAAVTL